MSRIRVSDNFCLDEFVHPQIYATFGEKSILWLRPEIIKIAQKIRDKFGIIIINNWSNQGTIEAIDFLNEPYHVRKRFFTESGLRTFDTDTGAKYSMHKYGCAVDLHFIEASPEEVRNYIKGNYRNEFKALGLTRMEDNTAGWLHVDIANTGSNRIDNI